MIPPHNISTINLLSEEAKREIYARIIPDELLQRFALHPDLRDQSGNDLLLLTCRENTTLAEMKLFHQHGFPDPVLYGHITDTMNGQIHVLLYILNDPDSPRFDVDRMPDASPTQFGTTQRNILAETAALQAGISPGQVRRGLRLLGPAILAFERFVTSLGHTIYFTEPLYYHNAILFEKHGFAYSLGQRLMERIHTGFSPKGDLAKMLDGSNPFRQPEAAHSIRLRSWALHDRLLGEPFTGVTMYKWVGKNAGRNTSPGIAW